MPLLGSVPLAPGGRSMPGCYHVHFLFLNVILNASLRRRPGARGRRARQALATKLSTTRRSLAQRHLAAGLYACPPWTSEPSASHPLYVMRDLHRVPQCSPAAPPRLRPCDLQTVVSRAPLTPLARPWRRAKPPARSSSHRQLPQCACEAIGAVPSCCVPKP